MDPKTDSIALDLDELRVLGQWSADCAERALPIFEARDDSDRRPHEAIVGIRAERVRLDANGSAAASGTNRIPCRPASTIYKGKYLDQSLETDFGTVKARIWDSDIDLSQIDGLWWAERDCMVMPGSPEETGG